MRLRLRSARSFLYANRFRGRLQQRCPLSSVGLAFHKFAWTLAKTKKLQKNKGRNLLATIAGVHTRPERSSESFSRKVEKPEYWPQ